MTDVLVLFHYLTKMSLTDFLQCLFSNKGLFKNGMSILR